MLDEFTLVSPSPSSSSCIPTGSGNSISYQTYSVRLPVYVLGRLREIAERDSCPVSHVVRLAVRRYLFGSGCSHES